MGVDVQYFDGFLGRNRSALEQVLEQHLAPLLARIAANSPMDDLPELCGVAPFSWTPECQAVA